MMIKNQIPTQLFNSRKRKTMTDRSSTGHNSSKEITNQMSDVIVFEKRIIK